MSDPKPHRCDFCGRTTERVQRIALDQGYDRLGRKHAVRYACTECSREKQASRRASLDARPSPL